MSRLIVLVGAVAAIAVVLGFLILQEDPTSGIQATFDGSELTVELDDGASITVPARAAEPGSLVRVTAVEPESLPALPEYVSGVLGAWDFDVEGGIVTPVTIRLPAPPDDESWVLLHYKDGEWVPTGFDLVGREIVASLDSLSWVGLGKLLCTAVTLNPECEIYVLEAYDDLSDLVDRIIDPDDDLCLPPDYDIVANNGQGNSVVHGCGQLGPESSLLIVRNLREFFLDIYPSDPTAVPEEGSGISIPSPWPAGRTVAGGSYIAWSSDIMSRDLTISGTLSTHALLAQVGFWALSLIPGLGELADAKVIAVAQQAAASAVDDRTKSANPSSDATKILEQETSLALVLIRDALSTPTFLVDVATIIWDTLKRNPGLVSHRGLLFGLDALGPIGLVMFIIDVADVGVGVTDLPKAWIETDGDIRGAVSFSLQLEDTRPLLAAEPACDHWAYPDACRGAIAPLREFVALAAWDRSHLVGSPARLTELEAEVARALSELMTPALAREVKTLHERALRTFEHDMSSRIIRRSAHAETIVPIDEDDWSETVALLRLRIRGGFELFDKSALCVVEEFRVTVRRESRDSPWLVDRGLFAPSSSERTEGFCAP